MNLAKKLSNMFFSKNFNDPSQEVMGQAQPGVVIPFPSAAGMQEPAGAMNAQGEELKVPESRLRPQVLFHLPDLRNFLDLDHLAAGRRQGVELGNAFAHDQGREAMIADFQLRLQRVIEFKQAKLDMLEHMGLQTRGLGLGVAEEVDTARLHLQRDIDRLKEQIDAAAKGQGWIAGPIKQYGMGFSEGVRIRMNFYITQ